MHAESSWVQLPPGPLKGDGAGEAPPPQLHQLTLILPSYTVTLKVPVAVFPAVSVVLQLTVVIPIGNDQPEGGLHTIATFPSTASEAEASNFTGTVDDEYAVVVISRGNVSFGATRSRTVTVNFALASWPDESVTEQVTVVVPSRKDEPEEGVHLGTSAPSTRSDPLIVQRTFVPWTFS